MEWRTTELQRYSLTILDIVYFMHGQTDKEVTQMMASLL